MVDDQIQDSGARTVALQRRLVRCVGSHEQSRRLSRRKSLSPPHRLRLVARLQQPIASAAKPPP